MTASEIETSPRRRGAPLGNRNALRHGLYARNFHRLELSDLDVLSLKIPDEIILLRVMIRRLLEYADQAEMDVNQMTALLNTLSTTAIRIASLTRTQALINGSADETGAALSRALVTIYKELNIE